MRENNTSTIVGSTIAIVAIIGYVLLAALDKSTTAIQNLTLFAGPFITYLLMRDKMTSILDKTRKIDHNTNGMLQQRVEDATTSALHAFHNTDKE